MYVQPIFAPTLHVGLLSTAKMSVVCEAELPYTFPETFCAASRQHGCRAISPPCKLLGNHMISDQTFLAIKSPGP
jgi:hypothetical protein